VKKVLIIFVNDDLPQTAEILNVTNEVSASYTPINNVSIKCASNNDTYQEATFKSDSSQCGTFDMIQNVANRGVTGLLKQATFAISRTLNVVCEMSSTLYDKMSSQNSFSNDIISAEICDGKQRIWKTKKDPDKISKTTSFHATSIFEQKMI